MKVLIVEDDPIFQSNLEMLVELSGYTVAGVAEEATEALRLTRAVNPDLVLLDIHIKGLRSGLDVADEIREQNLFIPIIFITSIEAQDVFQRAKESNPFAYIIKPFNENTLQKTIELAVWKYANAQWDAEPHPFNRWESDQILSDSFFVKTGKRLMKINIEDIGYIKVDQRHSDLFVNGKVYTVKMSLNELYKKLPVRSFVKTHRNYLVNIKHIEGFDIQNNKVFVGGDALPISKRQKESIIKKLNLIQ